MGLRVALVLFLTNICQAGRAVFVYLHVPFAKLGMGEAHDSEAETATF